MGATRQNLQVQPKNLKKLSEHQLNQSEVTFYQKTIFSILKVTRSQQFVSSRNLQVRPKILKIISEFQIRKPFQTKKIHQKVCLVVSPSKMKRSQKFVWRLPDGICRLDPKTSKKLSEHQLNQSERWFYQKTIFSTLKVTRSQKFVSGLLDEIRPMGLKNDKTQIKFKKPNLKR
jgi:hypothetical protein